MKWFLQHLLFILIMIFAPVICRRHNSLRNICTLCSWSFVFWQHFKARIISQSFRTELSFSKIMGVGREGRRALGPLDFENFRKNRLFSWFWVGETQLHLFGPPRNFWKILFWLRCKKIPDAQVQSFHMNFDISTVFTFEKLTKETSTWETWK